MILYFKVQQPYTTDFVLVFYLVITSLFTIFISIETMSNFELIVRKIKINKKNLMMHFLKCMQTINGFLFSFFFFFFALQLRHPLQVSDLFHDIKDGTLLLALLGLLSGENLVCFLKNIF